MRSKLWLIGASAAAVAALGIGVAAAQTGDSSTTTSTTVAPGAGPNRHEFKGGRPGMKGFGFGGMGGPGIHGEFTVPDGNGGYRTMDSQVGTVTSVSSSAIEVKSEDGFTKKYTVDTDTLVNAGRDGIGSVKSGDKVAVEALASGSTAKAIRINDVTNLDTWHQRWAPKGVKPAPGDRPTS
jgi:hypothetical protein